AEPVEQSSHSEVEQHSTKALMLGALGVVYGDIGTRATTSGMWSVCRKRHSHQQKTGTQSKQTAST
ncbi:hypothetical protein EN829_055825, partial [Mesorhizobium sp. M00.F.Ca.ET.186.01.1.1]